jgi:hypothetical protein
MPNKALPPTELFEWVDFARWYGEAADWLA